MYTRYWHLNDSPFLVTNNDSLVYMTDQYREGIARLYYLIKQERIAGMLTGDFGVGKTMVLHYLERQAIATNLKVIKVDAIPEGALPMARHILRCLEIEHDAPTFAEALMLLQEYLQNPAHPLERRLLLIDEAHQLAYDQGFYLVHYLCNLRFLDEQTRVEKPLFTIILAGINSLREKVAGYESLRRRIQLDWQLHPLSREETFGYVKYHLSATGGSEEIFSPAALDSVYQYSGGIPRSINNICDTALMLGFAAPVNVITPEIVAQAASDTGLDAFAPDHV